MKIYDDTKERITRPAMEKIRAGLVPGAVLEWHGAEHNGATSRWETNLFLSHGEELTLSDGSVLVGKFIHHQNPLNGKMRNTLIYLKGEPSPRGERWYQLSDNTDNSR